MKEIELTHNQITLVDDEDFEYLNQWKWDALFTNENYVACRYNKEEYEHDGKTKTIYMARVIMKTSKNMECDHVFHNTLDNRKFIEINGILKPNLRNCTHSQNCVNRKQPTTTGYRGVTYNKRNKNYMAQIKVLGNLTYLGSFKNSINAAKAYDKAASKHFKEFAQLNFKE